MSSITVTDITVAKTPVFYLNLRDPRDVALLHSPQTSAAATPASPTSPVGSPR